MTTEKDFVLPFSQFELGDFVITVADVEDAQRKWGDGIVKIATTHSNGGNYVEIATNHVEHLYAYDLSEVLFKPTMASSINSAQRLKVHCPILSPQTVHVKKTVDLRSRAGQLYDSRIRASSSTKQMQSSEQTISSWARMEMKQRSNTHLTSSMMQNLRINHHSSLPASS